MGDFFLYGTAAALVFPALFFPEFSETAGVLLAFSTYAVGFAARPLGGIVFGHYGDRIGRKAMLILSLLIMGIATFLIGSCRPTKPSASWLRSCSSSCASVRASESAGSGAGPS